MEILKYSYTARLLLKKHFILRYNRTYLGLFWAILNPLFSLSVMVLVFSTIFGVDPKVFALFLFSGIIPWFLFSTTVTSCSATLYENEGLIKKIYLPKIIFPFSATISVVLDSLLLLISLMVLTIILDGKITLAILILPISYILLFFFSIGVGLASSILTTKYKDFMHIIPIILQAGFFLSPIIYDQSRIDNKLLNLIFEINPLTIYIDLFRTPLYIGNFPELTTILYAVLLSSISFVGGLIFFNQNNKKVVYVL